MDEPGEPSLDDVRSSGSRSTAELFPSSTPLLPTHSAEDAPTSNEVAGSNQPTSPDTTQPADVDGHTDSNVVSVLAPPSGQATASIDQGDSDHSSAPTREQLSFNAHTIDATIDATDSDNIEQHVSMKPTNQPPSDILSLIALSTGSAAGGKNTTKDSTIEKSCDSTVVALRAHAVPNEQSTTAHSLTWMRDGAEMESATETCVASFGLDSIASLLPPLSRAGLHTAVPTVLSTFLTSTDDMSHPPTADGDANDAAVDSTATYVAPASLEQSAEQTAPVAYPPSALIPSLSTAALDSLLNFRSSASPLSPVASHSSLTAALRTLKHVLDYPLLPPARPDDRRGYEFSTLSRPMRVQAPKVRRSHKEDAMAHTASERDRLHRTLQDELDAIQRESSALAAHYPLDTLNASMLQADDDANRIRLPRKERSDFMSAEHSRAINRVQRDRKQLREEEAMTELLFAVSSPPPTHTLPPLTASTTRSRVSTALSASAMQSAASSTMDWS